MSDLTTTAQAVQQAVAAVDPAALTPLQLAMAAGPVLAHLVKPYADRVPAGLRPLAIGLGMAAVTTLTAVSQGTPWKSALGYGLTTAFGGKLYHALVLKDGGVLAPKATEAPKA